MKSYLSLKAINNQNYWVKFNHYKYLYISSRVGLLSYKHTERFHLQGRFP